MLVTGRGGGHALSVITAALVLTTFVPGGVSAQSPGVEGRDASLGLSIGAGAASRLAPSPCFSRERDPRSRSLVAADLRGVITQDRLRLEARTGLSRFREDPRTYVCPLLPPDEDAVVEEEEHPRGTGMHVWASDLRLGVEVSRSLGLMASAGVGRMWSHHRSYLAAGVGVRRGDRLRLAVDLETTTFRHGHDVVRRRAQTSEELGRERFHEWRTGVGFKIGAEVPVWGQVGNR